MPGEADRCTFRLLFIRRCPRGVARQKGTSACSFTRPLSPDPAPYLQCRRPVSWLADANRVNDALSPRRRGESVFIFTHTASALGCIPKRVSGRQLHPFIGFYSVRLRKWRPRRYCRIICIQRDNARGAKRDNQLNSARCAQRDAGACFERTISASRIFGVCVARQ